jgi:hypothetical protein
VAKSNLGASVSQYVDRVPTNTAPTVPKRGVDNTLAIGQRVLIFGCGEVATKTPIVNFPNRAVLSGQSGFYTFKGSINERWSLVEPINVEQQLTLEAMRAVFDNGAASLPNKSGLSSFGECIACLYYAKATQDNTFIQTQCPDCWNDYCAR